MADQKVDVKRAAMAGGKRGSATLHLRALNATPLQPASPDVSLRLQLQTPHQVLETYIVGHHDIQPGDVLVVGDREFTIRGVAAWRAPGRRIGAYTHIVVEDVQL